MVIGLMSTSNTQFTAPAVRHLTWCLLSPPLAELNIADSLHMIEDTELISWLQKLDLNPAQLNTYIQQRNHKLLGSYFECLWAFYFEFGPNSELLADHIQVIEGKQTLGELDALVKIKDQFMHVELAVKFYLLLPNKTGLKQHHWIGPQSHDRLDLKLDKLSQKQFPFLHHPATIQALKTQQLSNDYKQILALKGYLFHPFGKNYQLPEACSSSVNICNWIHAEFLETQLINQTQSNIKWSILPKHQWFGPLYTNQPQDILDANMVAELVGQHFQTQAQERTPYALMLVKLDNLENGYYLEQERFFVVHNQWPTS